MGGQLFHLTTTSSLLYLLIGADMVAVAVLGYKVFETRMKQKPRDQDIQTIADEVKKLQRKEELDQIDKQNRERNGDDKYSPANIK